jgi:hypothetical protein
VILQQKSLLDPALSIKKKKQESLKKAQHAKTENVAGSV